MTWQNIQFDFTGASVLLTGGTSGLGAAAAAAFRKAGASVSITGTRGSPEDYDTDLSGYRYYRLDVENRANIDAVAEAVPRLDILINSAGLAMFTLGLDEYDPDVFDRAIAMHLTSVYRLATRLAPKLRQSRLPGGASIVNTGSMSSFFGMELLPGYGAGKTGLLGVTRAMAVHWARQNIRVNTVAAGLTESRMTRSALDNPEINAAMLARVPMGRHGMPNDIAGATLFLCSAAAGWITGQVLAVDGGFSIMA